MAWDDYTHRDLARDYEGDRIECTCADCGKKFLKGEEGDNERICLRCQESSRIERMRERGDDGD